MARLGQSPGRMRFTPLFIGSKSWAGQWFLRVFCFWRKGCGTERANDVFTLAAATAERVRGTRTLRRKRVRRLVSQHAKIGGGRYGHDRVAVGSAGAVRSQCGG